MKYILAAFLFAIASFASANEVATPEPITLKPSVTLNNQSASNAASSSASNSHSASSSSSRSASDASNALSIGGDKNKSLVAVFPPPSTAAVPVAQNCIVTKSTAGGLGWNLIQGAGSEQYSDPVCILQWLEVTATSDDERASIRAEIMKRIGSN